MSSDGLTAAVSAPNGPDGLGGRLYILTQTTGGIWTLVAEFSGSQFGSPGYPGRGLGESVAVSGDGLTAAATLITVVNGVTVLGVAVVRNTGGTWGTDATLIPPSLSFVGMPLAMSDTGTTLVVGNAGSGNVLVYQRAGTWTLSATLTSSVSGKAIGWAVAVSASGDRILTSSRNENVEAFTGVGNAWSAGEVLVQSDPSPPDAFGFPTGLFGFALALSADGRTAVVSDPVHNGGAGSVYVYVDLGGFIQEAELTSSAPGANDLLGFSVGVDGTGATVVAGAPRAGDGTDQGEVLEFTAPSGGWHGDANEDEVLVASDAADYSYFGQAVAISASSNYSLVGAARVISDWYGVWRSKAIATGVPGIDAGAFYSFGPLQPTSTALTIAPQPAIVNQPVTFSATVKSTSTPDGGDVTFQNGGKAIPGCTQIPIDTDTGIASCQTTLIALGTFPITALYSGDAGYDGSTSPAVNLQVITQPVVTGVVEPAAANVFYSTGFGGSGGTPPYTFSLSGTLPTGLSWIPPSIEGKPTQANSVANLIVIMTDSSVPPAIVNRSIQIVVSGTTYPPLLILWTVTFSTFSSGTTLPGGVTGTAYGISFQALGGDSSAKVWSLANGTTLPATLSLASNGSLSGTLPSTPGVLNFDVQVANQSGLTPPVVQSFTIQVLPRVPPPPLAPGTPVATVAGAPDSSAIVTWAAPANAADAPVISYTVTSSPGGISQGPPTVSPGQAIPTSLVMRGLTPGVAYTFTVVAGGSGGFSAPSSPSNAIVAVGAFPQNSQQFTSKSGATFASAATPSGSITANAVGLGTVVVADYPDSPYAPLPSAQSFVDVKTLAGSAFTSVTLTVCSGAAASGLQWWNATAAAWQPVAPGPTLTGTCARFTVTATSTPNLSQLTGTPFALLTSPTIIAPPLEGLGQPGFNPPNFPDALHWSTSVAVSGDGTTALVGAPGASLPPTAPGMPGAPAVAVLSNTAGTWQVQSFIPGPALTNLATGTVGLVYPGGFGERVALSSDESTALVTASDALGPGQSVRDNPQGATFVFHQTAGVWTQQAELSEPFTGTGLALTGTSIGLSSDGTTAFVTSPFADRVWIYSATNGVWSNQAILTPSDPQFIDPNNPEQHDDYGEAAAISADGNTLVVGAWQHKSSNPVFAGQPSGAVYVYTRVGTTWTQKVELVPQTPDALSMNLDLGRHVAVSADGTTVFATEYGYHDLAATETGAVAVFVSHDGWATWTQTALLVSPVPDAGRIYGRYFGEGLALASGGQTLLVSDQGEMVWIFAADHGGWTSHGVLRPTNLTPDPAVFIDPNFGANGGAGSQPIALSSDGHTLAVGVLDFGSLNSRDSQGYLYLYRIGSAPGEAPPVVPQRATPTVIGVSPASGAAAGGTAVTISGTNFSMVTGATSFAFGSGNLATGVVCRSATSCAAVTPAGVGGTTVDVIATVVASSSAANPPGDQFRWTAVTDTTPPVTTAVAAPLPNAGGWNNGDVTITLTSTDSEPGGTGVKQITYSAVGAQTIGGVISGSSTSFTISAEGVTTVRFFGTDNAGNIETPQALTIKLDKTPPTVTASRSPGPNANDWNNSAVTITFRCSDSVSGLAAGSPPSPTIVSTQGKSQSVTGTCTDNAGNSASLTVGDINIDLTSPSISGSASPQANQNGWNNGVVTVSFQCADDLSGLAAGSPPAPTTLVAEGANQSVSGSCTDLAGNTSSVSVSGVKIDLTPPTITIGASAPMLWPPNGKLVSDTISGIVADGLSGIDPSTLTFRVVDEYGEVQPTGPISLGPGGQYSFTVFLEASRLGQDMDGRQYQIIVSGKDGAGNTGSASTVVTVPHDQGNR